MKPAVLLTLGALLAIAGNAAAGPLPPGPIPILDLLYENSQSIEACLAASVQGNLGLRTIDEPPFVALDAPAITPPTPDCLILPGGP